MQSAGIVLVHGVAPLTTLHAGGQTFGKCDVSMSSLFSPLVGMGKQLLGIGVGSGPVSALDEMLSQCGTARRQSPLSVRRGAVGPCKGTSTRGKAGDGHDDRLVALEFCTARCKLSEEEGSS